MRKTKQPTIRVGDRVEFEVFENNLVLTVRGTVVCVHDTPPYTSVGRATICVLRDDGTTGGGCDRTWCMHLGYDVSPTGLSYNGRVVIEEGQVAAELTHDVLDPLFKGLEELKQSIKGL